MWAGNAIAGKLAVGHISPFLLTTGRWLAALFVLLAFATPFLRRDRLQIRKHALFLFLLGALGFTAFNNLFYLALNHTSAINVAIEQASMPLIVFLLNFLLFSIRVTTLQISGYVLTLIGVIVTVTRGNPFAIAVQPINFGDGLMLIAVLVYGVYSVALSRKPSMHWLSFITVLAGGALAASIPFSAWEIAAGRAQFPDTTGIAVIVYTAIFPSIIAQSAWVRGLELIGSNRAGIFINLVPIFASGLAVVILGELFQPYHMIGMGLVLGGVWLSQRAKPARNEPI